MKLIILVAVAIAAVAAAPPAEPAKIIRSEYNQNPEGSYNFGFETEDGILRSENGELKDALDDENKPHTVIAVRGSYSYPDENGKPVSINYYADESGYHAEGDSIPKPVSRR